VDDLTLITSVWEKTNTASAAFAELARCLLANPGYRILSVSRWEPTSQHLHRVFSTDEAVYPVGGRKQKLPSEWSDVVLKAMKPHISPDIETIRRHFDDHRLIESIGISAILNIPIVDGTNCLGTMNLLRSSGSYAQTDIDRALVAGMKLRDVLLYLQTT